MRRDLASLWVLVVAALLCLGVGFWAVGDRLEALEARIEVLEAR